MNAELSASVAQALREAAVLVKQAGAESAQRVKTASEAPSGPVINLQRLREAAHADSNAE